LKARISGGNRPKPIAQAVAVDQRREFLTLVSVGREKIRLMVIGGNQVEQHDARR
jgi:hypothetical protein